MKSFHEVLEEGFWKEDGYYSFKFGADYELTVEPMSLGQYQVGLYQNKELILKEKLTVRPASARRITELEDEQAEDR